MSRGRTQHAGGQSVGRRSTLPSSQKTVQSHEMMSGNQIPKSTLAAQIVHNRVDIDREEPGNQFLFGRLLQEYLTDYSSEESSIETNAQLIHVVAKAGLCSPDGGLTDNPDALQRVVDSIQVLRLTIERCPDVLFHQEVADDGPKPVIFVWLVVTVLVLLCQDCDPVIYRMGADLVCCCITVTQQSTRLWRRSLTLCKFLRALINDASAMAESCATARIPSVATLAILWPPASTSLALPTGYQAETTNSSQALLIIKVLISAFLRVSEAGASAPSLIVPKDWVLDKCQSLLALVDCAKEDAHQPSRMLFQVADIFRIVIEGTVIQTNALSPFWLHYFEVLWRAILTLRCDITHEDQIIVARQLLLPQLREFPPDIVEDSTLKDVIDVMNAIAQDSTITHALMPDLKYAILSFIGHYDDYLLNTNKTLPTYGVLHARGSLCFVDPSLAQLYSELEEHRLPEDNLVMGKRPKKRQRIEHAEHGQLPTVDSAVPHLLRLLQCTPEQTLNDAPRLRYFGSLKDETVNEAMLECARIAALDANCPVIWTESVAGFSLSTTGPNDRNILEAFSSCEIGCCGKAEVVMTEQRMSAEKYHSLFIIVRKLQHNEGGPRSNRTRVISGLVLRSLLVHCPEVHFLRLNDESDADSIGAWCLRGLRGSTREARLAFVQILPLFLDRKLPRETLAENRRYLLSFLKALSDRNELSEQDTLVTAWKTVAAHYSGDELSLCLVQLVEYLGHPHPLISSTAYQAVVDLAEAFECSVAEMFRPHWKTVSLTFVQDLLNKPQKAQYLADLLGVSVPELLNTTQVYTIPFLIVTKRRDILLRIAQSRGPKVSIQDLFLQPSKNLVAVLALLLSQQSSELEVYILQTLRDVAPTFQVTDLTFLVDVEPILTACEILKSAAQHDGIDQRQAQYALSNLAFFAERRQGQTKAVRGAKMLGTFLESHILGIMAHFTEILDPAKERTTFMERKQALGAMQLLVTMAGQQLVVALPQMKATLQTALMSSELIDAAFQTWSTLVAEIEAEDLESVLDQTFAIIIEKWSQLSVESQKTAHDLIARLLKTHNALIRDRIEMIPNLGGIPLLHKFDGEIQRFKAAIDPIVRLESFVKRCQDENSSVVRQALRELVDFLVDNQALIHESELGQRPASAIGQLHRVLLDAVTHFEEADGNILDLCAQCIGILGCVDPNLVEAVRPKREIIMLSNFERSSEVLDFVAFMLEHVLVKAFHAAPTAKSQAYLAYVIQEILKFCRFKQAVVSRARASQGDPAYQKWLEFPESVRTTLAPFFNSKYCIVNPAKPSDEINFPVFRPSLSRGNWLRTLVYHLLHRTKGDNASQICTILARVIWGHDVAISSFLLPFVTQIIIVEGAPGSSIDIQKELLDVLSQDLTKLTPAEVDNVKQCSEDVFQILDHLSKWLQEKRKIAREYSIGTHRQVPVDFDELAYVTEMSRVEKLLDAIPAKTLAHRASECGSYARAIYHWEQHLRDGTPQHAELRQESMETQYSQLQAMYARIEEPDAVEGLSAHLHLLTPEQQALDHKTAGRWNAAQSWYELALVKNEADLTVQHELLSCLRESGQYEAIMNFVEAAAVKPTQTDIVRNLGFAAEAAWTTGRWDSFKALLNRVSDRDHDVFNVRVAKAMLALRGQSQVSADDELRAARVDVAKSFTLSGTESLGKSHANRLRLHALYELSVISHLKNTNVVHQTAVEQFDRRLSILGAFTVDKQYILGIRRAAFQLKNGTTPLVSAAWLTTAELARESGAMNVAYNAVLQASELGDQAAHIEYAKLLWADQQHRKAIDSLKTMIDSGAFESFTTTFSESTSGPVGQPKDQNQILGETQLLLARWSDEAGLIQSTDMLRYYHNAQKSWNRSSDILYSMAKYYNKVFDAEKAAPRTKQSNTYLSGECAKLAVDNFLRSMVFGAKHYYETVPKVLTFWLDLASEVSEASKRRLSAADTEWANLKSGRLDAMQKQIKKYVERLPAYVFYSALPQMMSRIVQKLPEVANLLNYIITKIISTYPQQALWSILAVSKSRQTGKATSAGEILAKLKAKTDVGSADLQALILQGQRLSDGLLAACDTPLDQRSASHVSLQRDLRFKSGLVPCNLVVPIEKALIATLPTGSGGQAVRTHKPFAQKPITIHSFSDDVLVLNSLQRPRKLTVRGSDGQLYGLLCKPKDDLRKDQRLMEFNAMICRALKWDAKASKRNLYIRMYAVTPLNEECGAIEWVDGLKPMRDIILEAYKAKGIKPQYNLLRELLDKACASSEKTTNTIFTNEIESQFPPILYEWFIKTFPAPEAWFSARLRYVRSCAVMSVVGHVLGLGDRHGENILLEEGTGGVFHVDFNCLFDKGLTFEKPEKVPFRLTHNMIDAFGPYGYEGPFRTSAELTLRCLRSYEDTLMTILETFLYDPTTDFVATGRPKKRVAHVPETPKEILESVNGKIKGFLPGENMPLSVDGYVEALIKMATNPANLAAMYIGWCAFF